MGLFVPGRDSGSHWGLRAARPSLEEHLPWEAEQLQAYSPLEGATLPGDETTTPGGQL